MKDLVSWTLFLAVMAGAVLCGEWDVKTRRSLRPSPAMRVDLIPPKHDRCDRVPMPEWKRCIRRGGR